MPRQNHQQSPDDTSSLPVPSDTSSAGGAADSVQERIYSIRLALGDGVRTPLSLARFSALIYSHTQVHYDPTTLSLLERGRRRVTLDDVGALARVDPRNRGRCWLAFGEAEQERRADREAEATAEASEDPEAPGGACGTSGQTAPPD